LRAVAAEAAARAVGRETGAVGATGNAAGKPPHLHYVIATLVPYPWRITNEPQGWRKMFFLDPSAELPR
jgi:peptidoglycan LD-endopeptidase LytH